jgi:hypothetical protein
MINYDFNLFLLSLTFIVYDFLQVLISIGDYFISTEIVLVFPFLPEKTLYCQENNLI